jgi:predicted AlkP superfamily phosphohydrolase/phosphomutase
VRPTAPDPVWASAATGVYPARNGVRSAAAYYAWGDTRAVDLLPDYCFSHGLVQLGFVRSVPSSSAAWRARPLWRILADGGVSVGVVRWPLTYPVEPVSGFIISDRFHESPGSMLELDPRMAYPADVLPLARAAFAADDASDSSGSPAVVASVPRPRAGRGASAAERDRRYSRVMRELRAKWDPQFVALRYQGLDTFGHLYLRYTQAGADEMTESERRRNAEVIDRYYSYIDAEIGDAMERTRPGELLMVVSGFGMQRLNSIKQLVARVMAGDDVSGSHERAPDGFLLAYGTDVDPGRHQRGSIVDVAPTVLYFLGFPVGRDMDGFARTDLFTRTFTAERPIAFIPSYR